MKEVLDKRIKLYSTENEEKSSVVERWNRTIKTKMWKRFTEQNSTQYLKMLPDIINKYNNNYHSSIKMSPIETSKKKNESIVYYNFYSNLKATKTKPKFKGGDRVRISKYKRKTFDKGYTPNWTEEIFIISEVLNSNPYTYKIRDRQGEEIVGSFYEQELLKTNQTKFRIEKVIRKNKKQALVKWSGYDSSFNSWIPIEEINIL